MLHYCFFLIVFFKSSILCNCYLNLKLARIYFYQVSGPHLDEKQVKSIVDEIKTVITASSSRKQERAERAKEEDFDAEERELLKEENEQEEELFDQVWIIYVFHLTLLINCILYVCFPSSYVASFCVLDWGLLGDADKNIQGIFCAFLWWAFVVPNTYVCKFPSTPVLLCLLFAAGINLHIYFLNLFVKSYFFPLPPHLFFF